MARIVVLTLLLVSGLSVAWSQTPPPSAGTDPDPANFTGGKVTGYTTTEIRTNRYRFAPGARTRWHSHERGQVIVVEEGRLRTQEAGGAVRQFDPQETFYTAPGVKHWHGATPGASMRQVSVSFGVTTWMEAVAD